VKPGLTKRIRNFEKNLIESLKITFYRVNVKAIACRDEGLARESKVCYRNPWRGKGPKGNPWRPPWWRKGSRPRRKKQKGCLAQMLGWLLPAALTAIIFGYCQ
jgi:hypothetical protein